MGIDFEKGMRMGLRRGIVILSVIAIALFAGYFGVNMYRHAQPEECYACKRPIHAHSRTVAFSNGHSRLFCCPACALSEQRQEGKPVEVKELTAFLTGAKLSPNSAYVVQGSDVNMCARTQELLDADKHAAERHYDRCAPSLLAFSEKKEALEFSRQHGGTVLSFPEAAASFGQSPVPALH